MATTPAQRAARRRNAVKGQIARKLAPPKPAWARPKKVR